MTIRIRTADLSSEITKLLREYTTDVEEGLEQAKAQVAKETAELLRRTSPRKTGSYAKGWRAGRQGRAAVVYNATDYQLTHLLEKGHAKRGGGRVPGIPHIGPAEEYAIQRFEDEVYKVIQR